MSNVTKGIICILITFGCFSTGDAIVKWVSGGYSVFQITFISSLFALIPIGILVAKTGGLRSLKHQQPGWVTLRTLLLVGESLLCYYAFARLPMATVYSLIFATPLIVPVLAIPLLKETIGWRRWMAIIAGFCGILIILRPGLEPLGSGHMAALASTLMFSLAMIIVRRIGNKESFGALLINLMGIKIVISGALMLIFGGFVPMGGTDLALLAALGVCVGFAQIFLVMALRLAPAPIVSPFQYSQMLWAIAYGALLFGNFPDGFTILGATIIIGSGVYVTVRERNLKSAE